MSKTTDISWADSTASPWFGCTEVSPGCLHCYARELTLKRRWAGWGDGNPRVRSKGFWKDVPRWNRKAENDLAEWHAHSDLHGGHPHYDKPKRPRIFPSLMDWLDPMVPIEWLADLINMICQTPNLDWLLLTKRPELFRHRIHKCVHSNCGLAARWHMLGEVPPNVWIGVTIEDQKRADERIPILCNIPARVRFLSVEPLLEPINLGFKRPPMAGGQTMPGPLAIHWVIVGGESGTKRRDCGVDAIVEVAKQCTRANVPVWVKQDCALKPGQQGGIPDHVWNLKQLPQ